MAAGVMTTLAFEMVAPDGSVTCPRKVPETGGFAAAGVVAVWEAASVVLNSNDKDISAKQRRLRTFIQSFHSAIRVFFDVDIGM
jgi:hypothetical protein